MNGAEISACELVPAEYLSAPDGWQGDPVYQATMALREPDRLLALLRTAWPEGRIRCAVLKQTSYNPGSRSRLVAELQLDEVGAKPVMLSLKVFASRESAVEAYAKACGKRLLVTPGPPVMLLDDAHAVAWWLPNGQNLKKARLCFNRQRFSDFLVKQGLCARGEDVGLPQLLRYVPRRRALFRWSMPGSRTFYLKFYERSSHLQAADNLALVGRLSSSLAFRVPRLLAYDAKYGAIVMDEVPGVTLTELVPALDPATFGDIGYALAGLHGSAIRPALLHSPTMEFQALQVAMDEVKSVLPSVAVQLGLLLKRLAQACPVCPQSGPVHGNLFGDQILVANGSIGIVDWDDLAFGDPLYDIGRLSAHLIYLALNGQGDALRIRQYLTALLQAYSLNGLRSIDHKSLRWHVTVALLLRAKISALRPLPAGWPGQIAVAVTAAEQVLEGDWLP